MEPKRSGFEDVARENSLEAIGIDAQRLLLSESVVRYAQAQLTLQIEDPRRDMVRVLADQRALTGRDVDSIKVVPRFVPIVYADVEDSRLMLGTSMSCT